MPRSELPARIRSEALTKLAQELSALSGLEMLAALGIRVRSARLRQALAWPFVAASGKLGQTLAEFDDGIVGLGLAQAAHGALHEFGVKLATSGACPKHGALLVLANHPGAYDALALMAAINRPDLLILAADRTFLRALPQLSEHLVFVGSRPAERAGALKRAVSQLRRAGAVLHFPAGQIEPDAAFEPGGAGKLGPWQGGVSTLARACARVEGRLLLAGVRGVHSRRAKALLLNRLAEQRGITTLAPLLQMVLGWRDVHAQVSFGESERAEATRPGPVEDARLMARLRAELLGLISAA